MTIPDHPAARTLLAIPEALFALAVRWRNRRYDRRGRHVRRARLPVISVGNLTLGGTGKTPLVAWLARRAIALGFAPAIVSRGYGGQSGRGPVLVSDGRGPLVDATLAGDEPYMLGRLVPEAIVVAGSDRTAGVAAAAAVGARLAILDDGFQHRRLARDADIVVLDGAAPFGNGRLLPAGTLREPPSSLARADVVVVHRPPSPEAFAAAAAAVRAHNAAVPVVASRSKRVGFVDAAGATVPAPERAVAFCGIGRPASFRDDLEAEGVEVVAWRAFRDHHRYDDADIRSLTVQSETARARAVTTEKDLARLRASHLRDAVAALRPLALRIETVPDDPAALDEALRHAMERAR